VNNNLHDQHLRWFEHRWIATLTLRLFARGIEAKHTSFPTPARRAASGSSRRGAADRIPDLDWLIETAWGLATLGLILSAAVSAVIVLLNRI
jgi:hypothetical protein